MRAAGRTGNEDCPVQMKLVAPPLYVLTTQTLDKAKGIQILNDAIEQAEESIKSHKGSFKVKEAPRTVSERDDFLLQSKVNSCTCKQLCCCQRRSLSNAHFMAGCYAAPNLLHGGQASTMQDDRNALSNADILGLLPIVRCSVLLSRSLLRLAVSLATA